MLSLAMTDSELLLAWQAGDRRALGTLYDRYGELVYRLAYRVLQNASDAEDLTQEVFMTLSQKADFNSKRGKMSTFLMVLTRSRGIDRLRRQRTQQQSWRKLTHSYEPQSQSLPMEHASLRERSHYVQQALQQLAPQQRQVLEMAYFDGLSQSEIAQKLDIPLGTIKSWSRNGLIQLRQLLKDHVG
ncbi:MAG: sigma-70 family RNA polymerase sigma factor [Oscillatoriales cyanobacterium SM2_2_1]|nr:sigma-70 family RNA polymerase sigma factor [Oscillatoriales cyanobacterium SM2_2_1]